MAVIFNGVIRSGDGFANRLVGSDLNDMIGGEAGNDTLRGLDGADSLAGGTGDDDVRGDGGDDTLAGDDGIDRLRGNDGDDSLFGGAGGDDIRGGKGNDTIQGGLGLDTLFGGSGADVFVFAENLLDRVDPNPGVRQAITTEEDFLGDFNTAKDSIGFDAAAFDLGGPLSFFSGFAADLPAGGADVIVLRDADNDGNPATVFNAGAAATLIAAGVDTPGAGFFVYFNSALGVNRLVYSNDLSDATADLQIIARFTDTTGQAAIDALADYSAANFTLIG